jgi:hypothetical protein
MKAAGHSGRETTAAERSRVEELCRFACDFLVAAESVEGASDTMSLARLYAIEKSVSAAVHHSIAHNPVISRIPKYAENLPFFLAALDEQLADDVIEYDMPVGMHHLGYALRQVVVNRGRVRSIYGNESPLFVNFGDYLSSGNPGDFVHIAPGDAKMGVRLSNKNCYVYGTSYRAYNQAHLYTLRDVHDLLGEKSDPAVLACLADVYDHAKNVCIPELRQSLDALRMFELPGGSE